MLLVKNVRNDSGKLTLTVHDKLKAWQSHYQKLLNVKFVCLSESHCV